MKKDNYLEDLVEDTGIVFRYVAERYDIEDFATRLMTSRFRECADQRAAKYAAATPLEMFDEIGAKGKGGVYHPELCLWCGEVYSYLQFLTKLPSKVIISKLPFKKLYSLSIHGHDLNPYDWCVEYLAENDGKIK